MVIDNFYDQADKSHFYLGMISQVYRDNSIIQVENLSWLSHRKIKLELLIPNTINYLVVVDTVQGLFIGETFQSKISSSDSVHESMNKGMTERIFPEIGIDIIGLLKPNGTSFRLSGTKTVGITDKVYIANSELVLKYLSSIEIKSNNSSQSEVSLSPFASYSNMKRQKISLTPSTLFNRHLMTVGTTNSGKSTSALSILDKLIKQKKKTLIIDPTGEYSMAFPEAEKLILGDNTTISTSALSSEQWEMLFETNNNTQGAILSLAIQSLRFQKQNNLSDAYVKIGKKASEVDSDMITVSENSFDLSLLPKQINQECIEIAIKGSDKDKYIANPFSANVNAWLLKKIQHKINNSSFTTFFSENPSKHNLIDKLNEFTQSEHSSLYINCSKIGTTDGIGGMIVDLISNHLINLNKNDIKPFVMFIDEVHRYTKSVTNELDFHTGLTSIAREGRKKGIFLFLTTQNPNDVPDILLGQIGTLLIHRLTHSEELRVIQNHLKNHTLSQIKKLNQGESILASINLLQDIHIAIDECDRKHNNDTPTL